jgi:hypothetical protein
VLHFVGMGSIGPQKLDRQNRTLANTTKSGATIHLFEVFEKSRYVYAGEVELAGEPYMSDQRDTRADNRFVWIFPLRRKPATKIVRAFQADEVSSAAMTHLPHGAYAVIGSDLTQDQIGLVNRLLDQLKQTGVSVFDKRDVDRRRYEKALGLWHDEVLDQARLIVRELIAKKRRLAKADIVDDELRINSESSEQNLRDALKFLDREDRAGTEAIFEQARQRVPMPEVPPSLLSEVTTDSIEDIEHPKGKFRSLRPKNFDGFT